MSSPNTTPALQVDATRLMGSLKYAFSGSLSVLGELLQNARRAGATEIKVTISFPDDNISAEMLAKQMALHGIPYYSISASQKVSVMNMSVVDNGSGIEDMSILLHVAHSGWDQDVQQEEHPYGLGFLSALFSASNVEVSSHGKVMHLDTTKVLSGNGGVVLEDRDTPPGTAVHLDRFTLPSSQTIYDITQTISSMVRGFPIPVTINGSDAPRPHAPKDGLPSCGIHLHPVPSYGLHCYLQGLPIKFSSGGRATTLSAFMPEEYAPLVLGSENRGIVLHLPSSSFRGKMPDRSHLYQEDEALGRMDDFLSEWQVRELAKVMAKLPDSRLPEFANAVTYLLRAKDLRGMFDGRGVIPGVHDIAFLTLRNSCSSTFPVPRPKITLATTEDIEAGSILVCSNISTPDSLHVTTLISRYKYFAGPVWARAYPDVAEQCSTWEQALEDVLNRDRSEDHKVWHAVAESKPVSCMVGKNNLVVGWYEELMYPEFQFRVVVDEDAEHGHVCIGLPTMLHNLPSETRIQILKDVSEFSVPGAMRDAVLMSSLKLTGDDGSYLRSVFADAFASYLPQREALKNRSFVLSFGAHGELVRVSSK